MARCMASLALLGTLSITSRPSLISPLPSSQQDSNSCRSREGESEGVGGEESVGQRGGQMPGTETKLKICLILYLEQELVLRDPLDRFDEVGGDGVGQTTSLLDVLQTKRMS